MLDNILHVTPSRLFIRKKNAEDVFSYKSIKDGRSVVILRYSVVVTTI